MQVSHKIVFMLIAAYTTLFSYGDSFTCNYGKQAACLDYGDKVCSSMSKCVSQNAICFDSYTCDYNGFICKSKFNNLADEYDDVVNQYNSLLMKYKNLASDYDSLQSCISYASTLEEAKNCY